MAKKRFRRHPHTLVSTRSFFERYRPEDHLTLDRTALLSLIRRRHSLIEFGHKKKEIN